jgi:NADH:ubiquinone oxidoreductase subunit 3 (subunit A)
VTARELVCIVPAYAKCRFFAARFSLPNSGQQFITWDESRNWELNHNCHRIRPIVEVVNWYVESSGILTSTMALSPYFSLAVLFLAALAFGLAPLGLAWLWGRVYSPAKPSATKNAIYECGLEPRGDAWVQFRPAYYLYAIIFLIFDVEAVFLLPFAVVFTGLGYAACGAMLVFVLLLVEGLAWAWAKGVLTWE